MQSDELGMCANLNFTVCCQMRATMKIGIVCFCRWQILNLFFNCMLCYCGKYRCKWRSSHIMGNTLWLWNELNKIAKWWVLQSISPLCWVHGFLQRIWCFQIQTKINAQPFGSHLPPKKAELLLVTLCEWQVGVAERNPTANKQKGELSTHQEEGWKLQILCQKLKENQIHFIYIAQNRNLIASVGFTYSMTNDILD